MSVFVLFKEIFFLQINLSKIRVYQKHFDSKKLTLNLILLNNSQNHHDIFYVNPLIYH